MGSQDQKKSIALIATLGTSPAVITELCWAIADQGWGNVESLDIITTTFGKEKLDNELLGSNGAYYGLIDELGSEGNLPEVYEIDIHVADNEQGEPLEDIRLKKHDDLLANEIQRVVRQRTKDPDTTVIASLAGGRKTMSAHLLSMMQLYGRLDDKCLHLLVDQPYENAKDFYYPTKTSKPIHNFNGEKVGDASEASVRLIEVPIVRLRSIVERKLSLELDHTELIKKVDREIQRQQTKAITYLKVDLHEKTVTINKKEYAFSLPDKQLSILAFLALKNKKNEGLSPVKWKDVINSAEELAAWFLCYYTIKEKKTLYELSKEEKINLESEIEIDESWTNMERWESRHNFNFLSSFRKTKSTLRSDLKQAFKNLKNKYPQEHFFKLFDYTELLEYKGEGLNGEMVVKAAPSDIELTGIEFEGLDEVLAFLSDTIEKINSNRDK